MSGLLLGGQPMGPAGRCRSDYNASLANAFASCFCIHNKNKHLTRDKKCAEGRLVPPVVKGLQLPASKPFDQIRLPYRHASWKAVLSVELCKGGRSDLIKAARLNTPDATLYATECFVNLPAQQLPPRHDNPQNCAWQPRTAPRASRAPSLHAACSRRLLLPRICE
jgi:hypothetical protein